MNDKPAATTEAPVVETVVHPEGKERAGGKLEVTPTPWEKEKR